MPRLLRAPLAVWLSLVATLVLSACGNGSPSDTAVPVPAEITAQLDRYKEAFSFEGTLDPAESDRLLGRLCADSFRMSYSIPANDETPPMVLDMNFAVVLSLVHMMHEAAKGDEPSPMDVVPKDLSDAWVPFARHKPSLRIAEVLRHYPAGNSAYIMVIHDIHEGLPESVAPGGAHHYETHLTWVKTDDGWRLQNKIWVDVAGE